MLRWARESGVEYGERRTTFDMLYQMHFSSDRKRMTSVVENDGRLLLLTKGAPEIVLEHCSHRLDQQGGTIPLTELDRETIASQLRDAAGKAMRTLAFAHRELPAATPKDEESLNSNRTNLERDLVFAGFVAIRDPLRPEVPAALAE